jgi:hypothetical protein
LKKLVREIGEMSFSLEMALWLPLNIHGIKKFCFLNRQAIYIFRTSVRFLPHLWERHIWYLLRCKGV